MNNEDLKTLIKNHRKWMYGEESGSRADLSGADLSGADLSGAVLSGADLSGADLSGAVLRGAVLSGADLSGAVLSGAVLSRAVLSGADLSDADLSGADLSDAVLSGAVGNMRHVKTVILDTYPVTYTADVMQIGCQRHSIAEWWAFDEKAVRQMDGHKAMDWWAKYKPLLQQIIATSPAEPTK